MFVFCWFVPSETVLKLSSALKLKHVTFSFLLCLAIMFSVICCLYCVSKHLRTIANNADIYFV